MLRRHAFASLAACAVAAGCATNPVTGKSELSLVSESQEIEMGKQAAAEVAQTIGLYHDPPAEAMVDRIGKAIAAQSERPNLPWEFHIVNDASVNAFALPGGFIYVTRGLLTAMNNEAELATVVGHEVGHVTNRHQVQQISRQEVAQLGLGIGSILSPTIARFGQLASAGLNLLFLKNSRDAESQADAAGFRYALNLGYDVREMAAVFQTLDRESQAVGGGKLPEWLETHPNPENRIKAVQARLDSVHRDLSGATVDRAQYLQAINGMVYGENPRDGFFRGTTFYHPDLRFQMTFPEGWKTQNQPQAVIAVSPNQDAAIQFSLAQGDPRAAAQQFLSQQGIQPGNGSTVNINGLPAASSYFRAQTDQGSVEGLVTFVSYNGQTYGMLGYTGAGNLGSYDAAFRNTMASFRQLTDPSVLNVQPAKVELVRVPRNMTVEQFNSQYPSSVPLEQILIINELQAGDQLRAGQLVKRVTGGAPGASTGASGTR
jgi:predicted Zn-dependent protease